MTLLKFYSNIITTVCFTPKNKVKYFTSSFLKKKSLFTDQTGEKEDRRVRTIKISLDKSEGLLLNARVECVIDLKSTPPIQP